jgi:NitT/TauT family transport system substrate-binding protein
MRRASFLASASGTLGALALGGGLAPARAAETVRFGTLPIDPAMECYYAQDMGFFEKAGIDAQIQAFSSGGAVAAGIVGGAINIGNVDLVSVASAHARGVPLVLLAPAGVYTKTAQTYVLLVPKTSSIRSAKDLSGKTIAVNGLKNINQIPTEAWIDNNGGDSKSVRFIEMPFPSMLPALRDGKIDVAAVTEPTLSFAKDEFRIIPLDGKNIAPSFIVAGWTTTRQWAEQNPDVVKRLVTVINQTALWANANHTRTAAIVSRISKLPLPVVEHMQRAYYGEKLDPRMIQPVIDATAKYGAIPKAFPASEIISPLALK